MIGVKKNNIGFTLMEIMISAGLFVIITVAGTAIYISVSSVQKANVAGQKIYTESRFLINMIANDIQSHAINYQDSAPVYPVRDGKPETVLDIASGDTWIKYWQTTENGQGVLKQDSKQGSEITLSSSSINITDLQFYIYPEDPTIITAVPLVTIVWRAQEAGEDISDPMIVNLQTTVSLRNY
jgi:Tfp pilus assembly protein PilV